jgi:hypothetical protein
MMGHMSQVNSAALSFKGRQIVSGNSDNTSLGRCNMELRANDEGPHRCGDFGSI